jgi:hypothetical protein
MMNNAARASREPDVDLPVRTIGNLLAFSGLPGWDDLRWTFAVAWHFDDLAGETWTRRLDRLKAGSPHAIDGAIRVLTLALIGIDWRSRKLGLTAAVAYMDKFIRPGSPISVIGEGVAARAGLPWLPGVVRKKGFGPQYRSRRVDDITTLIVLEDLLAPGTGLPEIGRAIRTTNEGIEVFGLALGKSESWGRAKQCGHSLSNGHVPSAWGRVWDSA